MITAGFARGTGTATRPQIARCSPSVFARALDGRTPPPVPDAGVGGCSWGPVFSLTPNIFVAPLIACMRKNSPWRNGLLRCNVCREYKPTSEFTPEPSHCRGFSRKCRPCFNATRTRNRKRRERGCRECGSPRAPRKWFCDACAAAKRRKTKRREKRHPEARRRNLARWIVRQAKKYGAFPEGDRCTRCGSTDRVELHHPTGFAHLRDWLNVQPLCHDCHRAEHAKGAALAASGA